MTNAPGYKANVGLRPSFQQKMQVGTTEDSFGAGVGRALQNVGKAARDVRDVALMKQALDSDTKVRETEEQYRAVTRQAEAGFLSTEGSAANPEARREYIDQIERSRQELAADLEPREREAFLTRTSTISMSRGDKAVQHEVTQSKQAQLDARGASIEGYSEDALNDWGNDDVFEMNLERVADETRELAALRGAPPEVTERAVENTIEDLLQNRVILMADKDPEAAIQYLKGEDRISAGKKLQIEENLEPMVREHRVNKWVSQFIVRGSQSDYTSAVAGAESSGGTNRMNQTGSSAAGLFGFTEGTFRDKVREMQRAGIEVPGITAGMTDAQIMAHRVNNDAASAAVHDYWVAQNTALVEATGKPASPQNMYFVHHFGQGGGPAMLRVLDENPGMPAKALYDRLFPGEWQKVVSQNPGIADHATVGELYAYAGRHIARGAGFSNQNTVQFDFAAAYSYAQNIEDADDRAAFLATVEAREATEARADQARRGEVMERTTNDYIANGRSKLSLSDQMILGAEGVRTFQNFVKGYETGALVDDPEAYDTLSTMSSSANTATLREFAADGSIEKYRDKLTDGTYRMLVDARAAVRGQLEGAQLTQEQLEKNPSMAVPITPEIRTQLDRHLEELRLSDTAELAARTLKERQLRQQMLDFFKEHKRPPENAEIADMLYAQQLPLARGNLGGVATRMYEYDTLDDGADVQPEARYSDIPTTDRERLVGLYTSIYGLPPTEDDVVRMYEDQVLAKGSMAMQPQEMADIPMEARSYASAMGWDDEELTLHWTRYLELVYTGQIDPIEDGFVPKNY